MGLPAPGDYAFGDRYTRRNPSLRTAPAVFQKNALRRCTIPLEPNADPTHVAVQQETEPSVPPNGRTRLLDAIKSSPFYRETLP